MKPWTFLLYPADEERAEAVAKNKAQKDNIEVYIFRISRLQNSETLSDTVTPSKSPFQKLTLFPIKEQFMHQKYET